MATKCSTRLPALLCRMRIHRQSRPLTSWLLPISLRRLSWRRKLSVSAHRFAVLEGVCGHRYAAAPDFEFKIPNVSTLPGFDAASGFAFRAFAGSFQDDGIGERFHPGSAACRSANSRSRVSDASGRCVDRIDREQIVLQLLGYSFRRGGIARVEYKGDQKHWRNFLPVNGTTSWI
jgi:hypothetical protein